jgi:cytochrome o ubiquinol oxidase subunit 2
MVNIKFLARLAALSPLLLVGACSGNDGFRLFHPVGPVASAEFHYTLISTGVMMLIIVPTTVLTCVFAYRYRKSANASYDPSWSHSLPLELLMWGVPLLIVVALAYFTYQSVFLVNPAGPESLNETPGMAMGSDPLQVDVVTTDWQWLFIYPGQKIATIDDLVVPAGRTVQFRLTSATVTNDFYIPQVAPMIDVMPGMRTLDAFRVDHTGTYEGFSADFSGAGFSWMQFATRIVSPDDFSKWVAQTQTAPSHLDYAGFQKLAQPTINEDAKPAYFSDVDPKLWDEVYTGVQQGAVYPVPKEMQTKAPEAKMPNARPGSTS